MPDRTPRPNSIDRPGAEVPSKFRSVENRIVALIVYAIFHATSDMLRVGQRGRIMFFSRKQASNTQRNVVEVVAWNNDACQKLAGLERFNVTVTSIARTVTTGKMREHPISFEVYGIMSYPIYIIVQLGFREALWHVSS